MRGYITGVGCAPQLGRCVLRSHPACHRVTLPRYRHLSILLMGLERCLGAASTHRGGG